MEIFVKKWSDFWTGLGNDFVTMSSPIFITVLIGLLIMYGVSSPSKKEQYKSWAIGVLVVLVLVVAVSYLIPWFIAQWQQQ